jgi:hypothetical protein
MPKHSDLSPPERREVVLALLRREEPATQLARRWGVSEQRCQRVSGNNARRHLVRQDCRGPALSREPTVPRYPAGRKMPSEGITRLRRYLALCFRA